MSDNTAPSKQWQKLIGIVLALTFVLIAMLAAFVSPLINSGPKDLPLAVGGPAAATQQITTGLEAKAADTFDLTTYATADEATQAVKDREAIGAITAGPEGIVVVTASGAGTPYTQILTQLGMELGKTGQPVSFNDVAPLTAEDPAGTGIGALALPLIFGGMTSSVALFTTFKKSRLLQIIGALAVAVIAGIVATAVLQFGYGAIAGDFWLTASMVSLGIAAISCTVLGLASLIGYGGIGLGGVIMLFVSNPLAGIATGPYWLPQPWGEIGRFLPVGAAGSAIRSAAFFAGGGLAQPATVLVCWVLAGLCLFGLGTMRAKKATSA